MTSTQSVAHATTPPQPAALTTEPVDSSAPIEIADADQVSHSEPGADAPPADAPPADPVGLTVGQRRRRVIGASLWVVGFIIGWLTIGIPTDPIEAFVWIWAATIAWNNFRPWRTHLLFLRDWAAVVVLLVAYNISRGWADDTPPHAAAMVHADKAMWGWLTGNQVPTVWLQAHLYSAAHIRWYDVLASFVYFSHFLVALTVAAVLWMTNRSRWARFARRWFTLTALGLLTYYLYPAAPPWWAAEPQHGSLIPPVVRISTRGWDALGLHHAGSVLSAAQVQSGNDVAAMPSLHSAYALLVIAFFLPAVRKRWWPLMLAYPLAMTFTLLYSGEHYMIDVLFGWVYVLFTYVVVGLAERAWARYKARRAAGSAEFDDVPKEAADLQKV